MKKLYFLFALCFATAAFAQTTYRTTTYGDWSDPAKWENGAVPPDNIGPNDVVSIEHNTYLYNKTITNNGTIRITSGAGYQEGTQITNNGKIIITAEGSLTARHSGDGLIINNYAIDNSGYIWNVDPLTNNGYIFNQGRIYNYQKLFYDGVTMQCSDGGTMINNNVICNSSSGYIDQDCGSTYTGNAIVTGCETLRNDIMNAALGVNTIAATDFSVSPNPANNFVVVKWNGNAFADSKIEVFDINGKTVSTTVKSGNDGATIDLSSVNSGVYFVKITAGNQTAVKKIIRL